MTIGGSYIAKKAQLHYVAALLSFIYSPGSDPVYFLNILANPTGSIPTARDASLTER